MRAMPYTRLLAYSGWIGALRAEEELGQLSIVHAADPKELANRLRSAAYGFTSDEYEMARARASQVANQLAEALDRKRYAK